MTTSNHNNNGEIIELVAVNQTLPSASHKSLEEFETDVALWEDPLALNQLAIEIHREYPSATTVQRHLVDQIVQTIWRQRRIPAIESAMMAKARKKQQEIYSSNSATEIASTVCNLDAVRAKLLLTHKAKETAYELLQLGINLQDKILPAHPELEKKWVGAKQYGEKERDTTEKRDPNNKLYASTLKEVATLAPVALKEWQNAQGSTINVHFLSNDEDDGFLVPTWHEHNPSHLERLSEEYYQSEWTIEGENALELSTWLIEVASRQYANFLEQDAKVGHKEIGRVEKGLFFADLSESEQLSKYEAHLHKHLLELINAYYVLQGKAQ